MATIQIKVDDDTKSAVDRLFLGLGLDTSTAVKMFLVSSLEANGLPFAVSQRSPKADLREAMEDTQLRRNLHGPYKTPEEAVAAMLED